jgi:hypothetical protein
VIPAQFRSARALRILNVAGVGLALAAVTSVIFGFSEAETGRSGISAFVTGIPTLVLGTVWAVALRWRATVGQSRVRWGWLLSVPLAMLNGGLAAAIWLGGSSPDPIGNALGGFLLGATIGAIVWLPALCATLAVFGLPIAWAQSQARQGLAGEERGEWVVGLTVALLSSLALLVIGSQALSPAAGASWIPGWQVELGRAGRVLMGVMGALGLAAGSLASASAMWRGRQRRRFVVEAEAGRVPGYRVEPLPEGKVLIRVTSQGDGYRVGELEEEAIALDAQGDARHAL